MTGSAALGIEKGYIPRARTRQREEEVHYLVSSFSLLSIARKGTKPLICWWRVGVMAMLDPDPVLTTLIVYQYQPALRSVGTDFFWCS